MNQKLFQNLTLILGILMIIGIIVLGVYMFLHQQTLLQDPCKLCMDKGYSCYLWRFG
jgi:disulfide bond formation protein DsbB